MTRETFVSENGIQITIDVDFDYEDGYNIKYTNIIVSHPGDWNMHIMSPEDVGDTYELELEWAQEDKPDHNDYPEVEHTE